MHSMNVVHASAMELFAETIEKTGRWLDELMSEMGTSEPRQAYSVLRALLHVLRDRLTAEEAVNLGAQLPMLVRGFYYDGWRPLESPPKYRHKADFLRRISKCYRGLPTIEQERAVKAVFRLLSRHITGGEIRHAREQLPEEIRDLWEVRT
ncbi:MAG: DUF2267 domain-containing protein [Steroidobacteraceae bacterium]